MDGTFFGQKEPIWCRTLKVAAGWPRKRDLFCSSQWSCSPVPQGRLRRFSGPSHLLGENGTVVEYKGKTLWRNHAPWPLATSLLLDKIRSSHFKIGIWFICLEKWRLYPIQHWWWLHRAFLNITIQPSLRWMILPLFKMRFSRLGLIFCGWSFGQSQPMADQEIEGVVSLTSGFECLDVMLDHVDRECLRTSLQRF